MRNESTILKFARTVREQNGHLIWIGGKNGKGYPFMWESEKKRLIRVHRWAYRKFVGRIPKGKIVMHTCDIPLCVKPDHLRIGTHADNIHDRDLKGRTARGKNHGSYKHGRRVGIHNQCRWNHICGMKGLNV